MTTWEVLRAIGRRWPIALVGVAITFALGFAVHRMPGVYWTTVDVYFIAPPGPAPAQIGETSSALVATAGLVEREVNVGAHDSNPVSPDVTIVGMGIYNGTYILLPNSGGQWTYTFTNPLLQVSSSAPSATQAASKREDAVRRVRAKLGQIQARDQIPPARQITTRVVPDAPQVVYDQGRPSRALGTLLLLGAGLTASTCVLVDGLIDRRTRRRSQSPASSGVGHAAPHAVHSKPGAHVRSGSPAH